jgi:hypothetical protein
LDLDENPEGLGGGSVRVATVLIYLSDAEYGGETAFPHSRFLDRQKQTAGQRWSDCAKEVVAALPRKGNASEPAPRCRGQGAHMGGARPEPRMPQNPKLCYCRRLVSALSSDAAARARAAQ